MAMDIDLEQVDLLKTIGDSFMAIDKSNFTPPALTDDQFSVSPIIDQKLQQLQRIQSKDSFDALCTAATLDISQCTSSGLPTMTNNSNTPTAAYCLTPALDQISNSRPHSDDGFAAILRAMERISPGKLVLY